MTGIMVIALLINDPSTSVAVAAALGVGGLSVAIRGWWHRRRVGRLDLQRLRRYV